MKPYPQASWLPFFFFTVVIPSLSVLIQVPLELPVTFHRSLLSQFQRQQNVSDWCALAFRPSCTLTAAPAPPPSPPSWPPGKVHLSRASQCYPLLYAYSPALFASGAASGHCFPQLSYDQCHPLRPLPPSHGLQNVTSPLSWKTFPRPRLTLRFCPLTCLLHR